MTEGPLRAFLMMRSDDGTWTVTVCRDLGAVMRTWKARKEPDRDVGVLHVGFDRPVSPTFDEIAGVHPGRMLLTTSAKHVLPDSFTGSDEPVGLAENIEIFIGLRGWGYSLTDPTAREGRLKPTHTKSATQEPQGWVASFLFEYPSDAEVLSAHGIHDDASYLERESNLERSVRHQSGLFRAYNLMGTNCDDPCAFAGAAPPWLAERDLTTLNLPVRVYNVFQCCKIKTIQDLAAWSSVTLLKQPNFGQRSLQDTVQSLNGALNEGPPRPHLTDTNCDDPCALAGAAPPWLAERDLATLNLPVRVYNVFQICNIQTVQDLAAWSPATLLKQPNFGRKSLQDTVQSLNGALNERPPRPLADDPVPETGQLLTEIRRSLLLFSDRERGILIRRLGFETPPETLQQIAEDYDVTRERIRQIEVRVMQKWIHGSYWVNILEQKITRLLIRKSFPLPVSGVEAIDSWFEGISAHLKFFKNLVQAVCKDRIHFVEIDGLCYFSLIDQNLWERTVSEAAVLLSSGAGRDWSEDYACSLVHGVLPDTAKEFGPLLWDTVSRLCHFSTSPDGSRIFTSYGRGAEQLVEAILAESDIPLHYTEITERADLREGKSLDPRTVHNAAANIGFLFAPGTYGLARHVPLSDQQMSRIRTETEDIVCSEASGRQWHTTEIFSELSERLEGGIDGLDKYVLDIALAKSKILRPLGKMVWIESGQDTDDQTRIDVHQACIAIIKAAGRPLSIDEIKERLTAVRGINEFFQIYPIDPLIRIRPGVWGINDRDGTPGELAKGRG